MQNKLQEIREDDVLTYGKYLQVGLLLQHSNRIQLRYKMLTSTWFLATFIGVGYTLSNVEVNLPFHPFIIVSTLCLASLFVIGIIWYLDLILQEKNIASAVFLGLDLETKHPWLPQVYHNVTQIQKLLTYVSMKSMFYLGCASILILTVSYSATSYLISTNSKHWMLILILIVSAIPILFILSYWLTKRTNPYTIVNKLNGRKY